MNSVCSSGGLSINSKKNKILAVVPSPSPSPCPQPHSVSLKPEEQPVAVVEEFEYLGSTITKDRTLDIEVNMRISKASQTFGSLYWVLWSRSNIKTSTKMCLFNSVVLSTLPYGSETWVPSAPQLKRLQSFVMWCLRVILGFSRWDQKRNTEL